MYSDNGTAQHRAIEKDFFTIFEAADYLDISYTAFKKFIKCNGLNLYQYRGWRGYINKKELDEVCYLTVFIPKRKRYSRTVQNLVIN
jgi:hypothetical protein